ncbi:MAG: hypothetical protein AB1762_14830 [Gemmatimonadota bacterium]
MKRLAALSLIIATACKWQPTPIVMVGPESAISTLAGEWSGEYQSSEAQRSGTIWFKLEAGRDTAFGDVLMIPRDVGQTVPEPSAPNQWKQRPQVLTVKFVRVEGQRISGAIDPYPSPDCGCKLVTTFRGELKGDRIEGDFAIHHEHEQKVQSGTWFALRDKKVPR